MSTIVSMRTKIQDLKEELVYAEENTQDYWNLIDEISELENKIKTAEIDNAGTIEEEDYHPMDEDVPH